jgi:C-terminal processing protease CtpA/Prc
MRHRHWIWILVLIVSVAAPAIAGGEKKCSEDTQACLNKMVAKLKARGWVGVELDKSEKKEGVYVVSSVNPDSPAMKAGIKSGDMLVAMNGIPLGDEKYKKKLHEVKKSMQVGSTVTYTVVRQGKKKNVDITLGQIPETVIAQWVGEHMVQHAAIEIAQN